MEHHFLFTFLKTYKLLLLALIVLFFTTVVLQVNYNRNRMGNYTPDEYYTISTVHPNQDPSKTIHRSLNGPRIFTYMFYPGALIGMMNHMGGNVWMDGWKYPGHNYIVSNYKVSASYTELGKNMKDPNLRYFHYYLKLQVIILMFLSFIPLVFYLWRHKYYLTMFMVSVLIGINFLLLKERSLFYIEPLLLIMINAMVWLYFSVYKRKTISLFWVILASFFCALIMSLKFSGLFVVVLILVLILSKFKEIEKILSIMVAFVCFFVLFFCLINFNIFYEEVKFSNVIHDYFSNFWHYATGSNKAIVENYRIDNLKGVVREVFFSLGGLVFLLPLIIFFGLKYCSIDSRIKIACFLGVILLSIWAIIKQRVYVDRNILPFIPSLVFFTGILIETIIKRILNTSFFKQEKRSYILYLALALIIFVPMVGHSKFSFSTLVPSAKNNISDALYKVANTNKRELKIIDYLPEIEEDKFVKTERLKSIPEMNNKNFKQVMRSYITQLNFTDIVLISEVKNNKQLANYLLPKLYNSNVQFSNHYIFYNKEFKSLLLEEYEASKTIILSKPKEIRSDLILNELKIIKRKSGYTLCLKIKSMDLNNLNECVLYFHGYPNEDEIQQLPEKRIKHGYDNWDFKVSLTNKVERGNEIYLFGDFTPTVNSYKKFNIGIYAGCDKTEKIIIENIKL